MKSDDQAAGADDQAAGFSEADRDRLRRRAMLGPWQFTFGELALRPFSLWTLDACDELGLGLFMKNPPAMDRREKRFQISALAWLHCAAIPEPDIDAALFGGPAVWREAVREFARRPEMSAAFGAFLDYIDDVSRQIVAASVEPILRPAEREAEAKEADDRPAGEVFPFGSMGIVWSIAGGQLPNADTFRFLYRQTPLPIALLAYHCALNAANRWTVGVNTPDQAAEKVRKAQAVPAAVAAAREEREAEAPDLLM